MPLIGTLTSGVSALRSFTKGLEVIGNNIANVNTTAYKSNQASFSDSFSNTLRGAAPSTATGSNQSAMQVGTGVTLGGISTNFTQGSVSSTGRGTDLAISGNGYFIVENPTDSTLYATRAGEFRWDDQGYLINQDGYRVQGLTGGTPPGTLGGIRLEQTLPAGVQRQSVSFDESGNVIEFYSDGTTATTNQLLLKNFNDPSALMKEGSNLYSGFEAAGPVNGAALDNSADKPNQGGLGKIQSGALELSNVDLTEEFANMITAQRSFQASSRLITVSDTVLEDIVNLKR